MELTARVRRVTADRYHTNQWRPHGTYAFSDASRPMWEEIWRAADGDLAQLVKYAEATGKLDPHEWVAQLHRFLFYTYPGVAWLSRYPTDGIPRSAADSKGRSRPKDFAEYCRQIAKDHEQSPYDRSWYRDRGVAVTEFIRVLRLEGIDSKEANDEALVSYVNSRIPDLGFRLREAFDLLTIPGEKATIEEVRRSLSRVAQAIRAEMER